MSNDNPGGLLANPLPLVMVVLLAAGVLMKHVPLQSARPNDVERVKFLPTGQQDVEARLWQDPFAAVERHEGSSKRRPYTPKDLRNRIQQIGEAGGEVKVIAASVFGGPYSEAAESRRRTRFAVLSALAFHGYSPAEPDAIGYFRITLSGRKNDVTWPASNYAALDFKLIGPTTSRMLLQLVRESSDLVTDASKPVALTVPYEWFERRNNPSSNVLVLWLNEDKFNIRPLEKLRGLIRELAPPQASRKANLNGSIFVHGATIPNCDLHASMHWNCFMLEPPNPPKNLKEVPIVRSIGTDDVLAAALLWELWHRGVNREIVYKTTGVTRNGQNGARSMRECADGLVLIGEWDSEYARALSRNLTEGFTARCRVDGGASTPPVRAFAYLRGVDGILPDIDKASAPRKEEDSKSKDLRAQLDDGPQERAEGRSQYDYLRRLGDAIARLDNDKEFAEHGVKAIGIVGSDVYDKLLILQALRSRFKDKIFFTTDLDARYLHADQKDWARNLVVASNFDLSLHPTLQKSTPPFRDGYQTATYLAVLMALETTQATIDSSASSTPPSIAWNPKLKTWLRPQIFEIGRTEAVHLASPSISDLTTWIESEFSVGRAPRIQNTICDDRWISCKTIEPERPPRGLSGKHLLAIISMMSFGILSLSLVSRRVQQTVRDALTSAIPAEARAARFWLAGAAALVLTVIATVLGINWAMNASLAQGGEPFVWLEGVSVWPSIVLQFVGLVTMIALVVGFTIWIRRQACLISNDFDLSIPQTWKLARPWWSAALIGPHLDLTSFGPDGKTNLKTTGEGVEITSLWQNYLRATNWREMSWWVLTSTAIMVLLGFALFYFSDRPSFPHRGPLVETLYSALTILNAAILWLVIFWVGYETRACARFVAILSDVPSVWPKSLLDREEARSGVPRVHLDDYLDFQLITLATRRIHWLIYLPFVLLLFLVLARSSLFDAMDFPLALVFITGLALAYALYTAVLLRRSAEAARAKALEHYNARLLAQARPKDAPPPATAGVAAEKPTPPPISAEQIKLLMERIRGTHKGAFAPFTQQPALQALLLPFGGYGGVQLIEYLINL